MTATTLRSHTAKDLAQMARERGVAGWHSMRKEELVKALIRYSRRKGASLNNGNRDKQARDAVKTNGAGRRAEPSDRSPETLRKLTQLKRRMATVKDLAGCVSSSGSDAATTGDGRRPSKDRLVVMVRGPYWLHAHWELNQRGVDRAQAALGRRWHGSTPVLRLSRIGRDGVACHERDVAIHGGVCDWYVDVQDPPQDYRMEIGYLAEDRTFHCLARSNQVSTPPAATSDALDHNWTDVAEQADRIFAMSGGYSPQGASRELQELMEERLQRPLGSPMATRYGSGASANGDGEGTLEFAVDAEMIVYGVANRNAHVTLKGEPVQLREDGSFTVRVSMPNRRQVVPVVASTSDGVEQQTIILAVERNTKAMEVVVRDLTG